MLHAKVMIEKRLNKMILVIFILFILITTLFIIFLTATINHEPESLAFCSYQPYWMRNCNMTEIITDLALIKGTGFDGVKIFYEYIVERGIVEPLLNYTQKLGLKVIFATHATYWGSKYPNIAFPNETIVKDYKRQLGAISGNISSHGYDHVLFIAIYYPIPFNYTQVVEKLNSQEYINALKDIVSYVKSFGLKVSLDTEGDPNVYSIPLLPEVDLYGIMPYSPNLDYMNVTYLESWASYFKNKGKHVYLSEYGFRTWKPKEHLALGMVSNETVKARLIREFVGYCKENFDVFTYFALFDADGGWGLAEKDTRVLRESGIAMLKAFFDFSP